MSQLRRDERGRRGPQREGQFEPPLNKTVDRIGGLDVPKDANWQSPGDFVRERKPGELGITGEVAPSNGILENDWCGVLSVLLG
jgi:hypothetical protein